MAPGLPVGAERYQVTGISTADALREPPLPLLSHSATIDRPAARLRQLSVREP